MLKVWLLLATWAGAWPAGLLQVPATRQSTEYTCGPAALRSVLAYWTNSTLTEPSLVSLLRTDPQHGTPPWKLSQAARALGLEARWREGADVAQIRAAWQR